MPDSTVYLSYGMEKLSGTTKGHALGARGLLPDGRVFRYSRAGGTALNAAALLQSGAEIDAAWDMDVAVESTHAQGAAVGVRTVPLTASDLTLDTVLDADAYAEGYLYVNDGPGQGRVYRISSHSSMDSDASTAMLVTLAYDDVIESSIDLTTASLVGLIANPYRSLVVVDIDVTLTLVAGVSPSAVVASGYFWAQTWGLTAITMGDNPAVATVGKALAPQISTSDESGVAVGVSTVSATDASEPDRDAPVIGYGVGIAAAATDSQMVFLTIAP